MTQQNEPGRTDNPTLSDFYHDMNQHRNAEYDRVGGRYVVEIETHRGGPRSERSARVVVWEAVKTAANGERCFVAPDIDGNRYVWDAVGEAWTSHAEADEAVGEITEGVEALRQWCQQNPYNGPRTPHAERDEAGQ